ncbi:HD family phosphohydrolase, partial [Planctomycetota bacterium]
YNDPRSINHCLLGLEVLGKAKVLEDIESVERRIIEKAIEYHGLKELPGDLDGEILLFCQLIRDADKIDIFYVVLDYYTQYRDNPAGFKLEIELPDEPGYSVEIVELILNEQRVDYDKLKTWNDMKLLQLSWVYDVNFIATLERIKERKYLEMIIEFLPDTSDITKVAEKIYEYVDQRIEQS